LSGCEQISHAVWPQRKTTLRGRSMQMEQQLASSISAILFSSTFNRSALLSCRLISISSPAGIKRFLITRLQWQNY
jgi:hypothetical protein